MDHAGNGFEKRIQQPCPRAPRGHTVPPLRTVTGVTTVTVPYRYTVTYRYSYSHRYSSELWRVDRYATVTVGTPLQFHHRYSSTVTGGVPLHRYVTPAPLRL